MNMETVRKEQNILIILKNELIKIKIKIKYYFIKHSHE